MLLSKIFVSRITPQTLFEMFNSPDYTNDNFKLLLEKAVKQGINLNIQHPEAAKVPYKNVTLLECCCKFFMVDIVKFLLENGAKPNYGENLNKSLHILAEDWSDPRSTAITDLLLKYGALTEAKNSYGKTAIELAVDHHNIDIVKLLIQHGAKVSTKDIEKLLEKQLSIIPENSRFFSQHLSELDNFKSFLATKPKLVSDETIQKLNEYIASYSTLESSSSDIIKDAGDITLGLINEAASQESKITGEVTPEPA